MNDSVSSEYLLQDEKEQIVIYRFQYCFGQIIQDLSASINGLDIEQRVISSKLRNQMVLLMPGISDLNLNNFFRFLENFYQTKDKKESVVFASLLVYLIYDFGMNIFGMELFFSSVPSELISLESKARFLFQSNITISATVTRVDQIL
ncbi:hypothetical protein K2X92_01560 [Candidatus Gracilibacteria bacterium]|nr:hypothetical protein [Candidatus Gracilibacteria bacterium]